MPKRDGQSRTVMLYGLNQITLLLTLSTLLINYFGQKEIVVPRKHGQEGQTAGLSTTPRMKPRGSGRDDNLGVIAAPNALKGPGLKVPVLNVFALARRAYAPVGEVLRGPVSCENRRHSAQVFFRID